MSLSIILMFLFFAKKNETRLLDAWIKAMMLWISIVYISLEILSVFSCVNYTALLAVWGGVDIILAICIAIQKKQNLRTIKETISVMVATLAGNKLWVFLSGIIIVLAVCTVPYNWDSMTYHLSRIANWAQNGSVAHYATHNIREIVSPVLAEFVNLHVYILSGKKDILFPLLQCSSMLTNIWLIYEIAGKIGCRKVYAYLAAFLFFTSPSAFGEALTTQVDQFATVWLLIFVYYCLDMISSEYRFKYESKTLEKCICMGLCIVWGYLTKPSVLVAIALLVIFLLWRCMERKDSFPSIAKLLACVTPGMFLMLLPELMRNVISFGSVSLPIAGQRQLVGTGKPLYVLVNGLKNFTFNLPNIYMYQGEHWLAAIVYRISAMLGVPIDDPSISEDGRAFFLHGARTYEPDTAVNSIIVLCFLFCMIWGGGYTVWPGRKRYPGDAMRHWYPLFSWCFAAWSGGSHLSPGTWWPILHCCAL